MLIVGVGNERILFVFGLDLELLNLSVYVIDVGINGFELDWSQFFRNVSSIYSVHTVSHHELCLMDLFLFL
jgi:hypothetical protein